jgi:hypothetical protein
MWNAVGAGAVSGSLERSRVRSSNILLMVGLQTTKAVSSRDEVARKPGSTVSNLVERIQLLSTEHTMRRW